MQNKKITPSVEALEIKAEKILENAKEKAKEILLNAKMEAKNILISELPMDSIDTKCHETIETAMKEATKMGKSSNRHCDEIKASADKKIPEVANYIVGIITGAN